MYTLQEQRSIALAHSALIDMLDAIHPACPPDIQDSDREVWFKAGRRDIVQRLIQLRDAAKGGA